MFWRENYIWARFRTLMEVCAVLVFLLDCCHDRHVCWKWDVMGGLNANVMVRSSNDSCARQMESVHEHEPDDSLHEGRRQSHTYKTHKLALEVAVTHRQKQKEGLSIHHYTNDQSRAHRVWEHHWCCVLPVLSLRIKQPSHATLLAFRWPQSAPAPSAITDPNDIDNDTSCYTCNSEQQPKTARWGQGHQNERIPFQSGDPINSRWLSAASPAMLPWWLVLSSIFCTYPRDLAELISLIN